MLIRDTQSQTSCSALEKNDTEATCKETGMTESRPYHYCRVVLMGRSIGSGPSCKLAAELASKNIQLGGLETMHSLYSLALLPQQ